MNIDKVLEKLKSGLDNKNKFDIQIDQAKHLEDSIRTIKDNGVPTEKLGSHSDDTNILLDGLNKFKELVFEKLSDERYFVFDLYNEYIKYLDSLTLLQESAFLHILMFIYIICSLFTLIGVFFGNELIKYLDLENKNTYLSSYLKLRTKFQRYYLIWTIFMLFLVCIVALFLNILAFTVKIV